MKILPNIIHKWLKAAVSLKSRNFRLLWFSMFASYNAMQMQMVANGWLVYSMTGSPLALGLVAAGWGVPIVLFSLYGGAVADRVLKRHLLVVSQSILLLLTSILTLLITADIIEVWHLVASSVLMGITLSFSMPARQAFIVDLVGKDDQLNAVALTALASNFCRVASPAAAGILLKIIGIPGVYMIIALSNLVVTALLLCIPPGQGTIPLKPDVPLLQDVMTGLRYVSKNAIILSLLLLAFIPIVVAMPYQMLLPVFAKSVFEAGETGLGMLMSFVGLGGLTGSGLITFLGRFHHKGRLMLVSGLMFALFLIFFGFTTTLIPACLCLLFVGAGNAMMNTSINALIMSNTPQELMGRMMSIITMAFGLMPLAMLPAGALAETIGAPLTVIFGGSLLLLSLTGILFRLPHLAKLA